MSPVSTMVGRSSKLLLFPASSPKVVCRSEHYNPRWGQPIQDGTAVELLQRATKAGAAGKVQVVLEGHSLAKLESSLSQQS